MPMGFTKPVNTNPWTIDDQKLLMKLHKTTTTMGAIYEAFPKRTTRAIHEKMTRIGLSLRGRQCKKI
jgi:hypothetical protein